MSAFARAPGVSAQASPASQLQLIDTNDAAVQAVVSDQRDALGRRCDLRAATRSGELRVLACGAAGVWIARAVEGASAQLVTQQTYDGTVTGLFVRDGQLWVDITSQRAQPLPLPLPVSEGLPSTPNMPSTPSTPSAPPSSAPVSVAPEPVLQTSVETPAMPDEHFRAGRVIRVEPGSVIVNLGSDVGLRVGEHISFRRVTRDDIGAERRDLAAIGRVTSVGAHRSRVELGLNENVPLGTPAYRTARPLTAASFAPPRAHSVWDVGFLLRGFLVLENLGIGALVDGRVGYHFDSPVHLEALISPVGFASARQGVAVPAAAVLTASLDARIFEVGLGIGGQTVLRPDISLDPGSGTTLAMRLRLGARDGAHLEAIAYMALFHSEFDFSFLRVSGQVPVGERAWIIAAGSGGILGLGYGEVGLRLLTVGNGGPGSFFLSAVVGGANVFRGCEVVNGSCSSLDYAGPTLGMGGEWRL